MTAAHTNGAPIKVRFALMTPVIALDVSASCQQHNGRYILYTTDKLHSRAHHRCLWIRINSGIHSLDRSFPETTVYGLLVVHLIVLYLDSSQEWHSMLPEKYCRHSPSNIFSLVFTSLCYKECVVVVCNVLLIRLNIFFIPKSC